MPSEPPTANASPGAPSHKRFAAGERLGRYVLEGLIESGGMSDVYLAHDPELDRKVALKLMRLHVGEERLHREAQALAQLSHPNVVPVFDVGVVGGRAFVAMEFVQGQSLRAWLKEPRSWRDVLRVLVEAGAGLSAAHARGIIHRDFKPANVVIGADGRTRVLDFGVARLGRTSDDCPPSPPDAPAGHEGANVTHEADSNDSCPSIPVVEQPPMSIDSPMFTRAGETLGTPAYMAPEQWQGSLIDNRADIFAFGVTAYEALFKCRPFEPDRAAKDGAADTAFGGRDLRSPKPVPGETEVPRHVRNAVVRALAFDPSDRWQSVDQMLAELQRDPHRSLRRAAVAGGSIVAIGLAVAGATGLVMARSQAQRSICRGGQAAAEAAWGPANRDAVRDAFAKTKLPYAGDAMSSVTRMLDAYAKRLARESDETCAATQLQRSQSEEVMDLRMACYRDRLREVGAFVDMLSRADAQTVQQATKGAGSLASLDDCSNVAALRATTPRPSDPATVARVNALEQRLAEVQATRDLGKPAEAAKQAEALLADASDVPFMPLLARINLTRGRAYGDLRLTSKAIPAFRGAFSDALESSEQRVLEDSATYLAQQYIILRDQEGFDSWADIAQASIRRGASDPDAQHLLDFARCRAFYIAGRPLSRLSCLEDYRAKVEPTRPLTFIELNMIGVAACDAGAFKKAVEYSSRASDESLRENGPYHPRTLLMRTYRCRALQNYGDSTAAIAECRDTLQTIQHFAAPDAQYLVRSADVLLGAALIDGNRLDEGRAVLEGVPPPGDDPKGVADQQDLEDARARLDLKTGHVDRALAHFRSALGAAVEAAPRGSPVDPDVIVTKLALGRALLQHGDFRQARKVLDDALAAAPQAEVAPTARAELEFSDACALWEADRMSRGSALDVASRARDAYDRAAPTTSVFDETRARMDAWLAGHRGAR